MGCHDHCGSPSIVQGIYQVFIRQNDVFLSHDAFYHHQFITLFFFFVFFAVTIVCTVVVERTRDMFGALFVKTLDYFHLLFRRNRFAFFSTICFNNYEVRILKTKRRSTGKSFTGETFCGVCLYLFICSDTLCDACLKMGSVRDC